MEPKQRKLLTSLFMSGTALIAVAVLDALKIAIYALLDPTASYVFNLIFNEDLTLGWIAIGSLVGLVLLEIGLASYIGCSARAEARGKKRNICYVIVAIGMAAFSTVGASFILIEALIAHISVLSIVDAVISAAFSAVVIYALVDVSICSLKNRKLNKQNGYAAQNELAEGKEVIL